MRDTWVAMYYAMPAGIRSLAATVHGYRLRRWRYGGESERLVEEALERDGWTADRWAAWSRDQLARALAYAAATVPYYRDQWAARRRQRDDSSQDRLENWPILEKAPVRHNPRAFLAEGYPGPLLAEATSGTDGQAIQIWTGRQTARAWYALVEARWRRWYGFTARDRWALVGSRSVVRFEQRQPPFWVWNGGLRQLYLSSYHLAPENRRHYLDALARYRIRYLWGHSSALVMLAAEMLRKRQPGLELGLVMAGSEPLAGYQRKILEAGFQCPVRQSYGMSEMAAAASECEHGRLHLWPETGWLEAVGRDGRPAPPGSPGDLLSTTFVNRAQPLVRYRVGDLVVFAPPGTPCPCGRSIPILQSVEGRIADCLYAADGHRITAASMDGVFDIDTPFLAAQLVQDTLRQVRVRYVADEPLAPRLAREIVDRVRGRLGDVEVLLEPVAQIERGAGGKHRTIVCRIPENERVGDVVIGGG